MRLPSGGSWLDASSFLLISGAEITRQTLTIGSRLLLPYTGHKHVARLTADPLRFNPKVPQDDWGGYPGDGKDDEIPCRRMRSSSYVKAMGDEESGDSDTSPKASPQKSVRPDALVKSVIRPRDLLDTQRYSNSSERKKNDCGCLFVFNPMPLTLLPSVWKPHGTAHIHTTALRSSSCLSMSFISNPK